jgi:hypothetical protein
MFRWRVFVIAAEIISTSSSTSFLDSAFFKSSGALTVNIDDTDHPGDKLLQLLSDNEIDLNVVEGLRLVIAFRKIRDPADRRVLIDLAERLAK